MTAAERDALIHQTFPLIKHVAHRLATRLPSNIEMRDLINAGVLGLLDAIDKFEPDRNVNDSEDCDSYLNYCPDDGANNPYAKFETRELSSLLTDAIDALPEKEQLVLSLYYYEEFTMKEIGALLGVNESRVSQLHTKAM